MAAAFTSAAQNPAATFDPAAKTLRLDGGNVTYIFGVNPRGELQQLYWGGRIAPSDALPAAQPAPEWASFDASYSNTPQEFVSWGQGLYNEPALKVSFPDGNRDLVLHYVSHTLRPGGVDVLLKDIDRPLSVTLHYDIDPASGVLARSATIHNDGKAPVTVATVLGYVKKKHYDGTVFHRVINGFMIQGGGFANTGGELVEKSTGKGIATSAGVLLGLYPFFGVLLLALVWLVLFLSTRYVSIASIGAAAALPVVTHLGARFHHLNNNPSLPTLWQAGTWNKPLFAFTVAISALAIWKHRANIQRLRAGTEHRFVRKTQRSKTIEN